MKQRDLFWIFGGRLITTLLGLVSINIATRLLEPSQYGSLALLVTIQLFCGMFLVNPLEQYVYRHAHLWWDQKILFAKFSTYGIYLLFIALVGAGVIFFAVPESPNLFFVSGGMCLMVFSVAWNGITVPMLNMLGYRAESVFWSVLTAFLGLGLSLIFVNFHKIGLAWFLGQALAMGITSFGAYLSLKSKSQNTKQQISSLPLITRGEVISYCLPLALSTGLMWLQLSGYRLIVEEFWGLSALGYITVGFVITNQIWAAFEYFATQFLYPSFYRKITGADIDENIKTLSDLLNILGPMCLALVGLTIFCGPALLYLLIDAKYQEAVMFISFGAVIECCRVLANFFSRAAHITQKTSSLNLPYALGVFLLVGMLCFFGKTGHELIWVAVSLTISCALTLLIIAINMYRQVAYRLDGKSWLLGGLVLLPMFLISFYSSNSMGIGEAIFDCGISAVIGGLSVFVLIWKNPAFYRLTSVALIEK